MCPTPSPVPFTNEALTSAPGNWQQLTLRDAPGRRPSKSFPPESTNRYLDSHQA
ncbi:hypothetical protein M378DRAFT_163887 [Amanita muscaria Koide BX008]|uniref:Uncharacterized protein n=1 Tax=Amanita muscaria (strain Koide BX008) TaxID=946122 RepID=A0A0C2TB24_AMAMK|nr:hypothetical protein M378DRAFT_163887 [Amanita muscaria Koide BX008]